MVLDEDILIAQNFIRIRDEFVFVRPLTDIGHRLSSEKTFALLQEREGNEKYVIGLVDFTMAPLLAVSAKFFKFIGQKMKHPHLLVPVVVDVIPAPSNKAVTIRPFMPKGSIRDLIYKVLLFVMVLCTV